MRPTMNCGRPNEVHWSSAPTVITAAPAKMTFRLPYASPTQSVVRAPAMHPIS